MLSPQTRSTEGGRRGTSLAAIVVLSLLAVGLPTSPAGADDSLAAPDHSVSNTAGEGAGDTEGSGDAEASTDGSDQPGSESGDGAELSSLNSGLVFAPAADEPALTGGTVTGVVWRDINADGVNDAAEVGLAGVTVELLRPNDTVAGSTTTNSDGVYEFVNPQDGPWRVVVTVVAPNSITVGGVDNDVTQVSATVGESAGIQPSDLAGGVVVNAAVTPIQARISGVVSLDTNANGAVNPAATAPGFTEPGLSGVQLQLVCVSSGAVIATTTSGAAGAYAFEAIDYPTLCANGVVRVRALVINDDYSISNVAGANDTPRAGSPQVGLSSSITLTPASDVVVNPLVRPDWVMSLSIPTDAGLMGPAVFTGSAPFDTVCPQAGNDCAVGDLTVRTADTVTFTWSVTASSLEDLSPTLEAVVLEQTLIFADGAIANFARIPARCKPAGGGGAVPPSVVVDQDGIVIPEGAMPPAGTTSVTLRCNLGLWSQTGDAVLPQPVVKISAESPNGSTFTTSAVAYAVAADGTPTAVPAGPVTYGPIEITSAPIMQVEKRGFWHWDLTQANIGRGTEPGYVTYAVIQLKSDRALGTEAIQQPVTITEDVFAFLADGTTAYPGMEFAILQCIPNPSAWPGTVAGSAAIAPSFGNGLERGVIDSGNCAIDRNDPADLTSDYSLTFDDIDQSGSRFPTQTANGSDLSAGPFYVASYRVQIFIPFATIDAATAPAGDNVGSFFLYNRVGDFDPDGISGTSNFGPGTEPGYCGPDSIDGINLNAPGMPFCDPMASGGRSDNVIGPLSAIITIPGPGFTKYILNTNTLYQPDWSGAPGVTNLTSPHAGNGTGEPGQVYETYIDFINGSAVAGVPQSNSRICDIFDNTVFSLVSSAAGMTNGDPNIYATLAVDQVPLADRPAYNAKWIFEFGTIPIVGDDPLAGGLNPTTDRYDGNWSSQRAARCNDDSTSTGWFTNPNDVPGGLDAVNAVRVRPGIDPATGELALHPNGFNHRLIFSLEIRDRFFGGPHAGEVIPSGTVGANFGFVRTDQYNNTSANGGWIGGSYLPSPETTSSDGDRITVTQASLALQKRTIAVDGIGDGIADFGITGAAVASNPIIWEVVSSVSSLSDEPADVDGLTITDVLPPFATYNPDCTEALTGGTPADNVLFDTPGPGQTTLVWSLGSWTPNVAIPNRIICTDSDPLAPQGTSLINRAEITFEGSPVSPFDLHTVVLEQTGEVKLRKTVDAPLDILNDDQVYSLSMQNFSQTLTLGAPTIIDVFPFPGDSAPLGGVNRSPASQFDGVLQLTGAPTAVDMAGNPLAGTFEYTTDAPATINQDLNLNTSTWVSEAALGGDFSQVTAIKFIATNNLSPFTSFDSSGFTVEFTLQAGDTSNAFSADANSPGDRYSNRFTAFSSSFSGAGGVLQTLASNQVVVRTVAHATGDLVFEDRDGNGRYSPSRDRLVPDGVTVELISIRDGGVEVVVDTTTTVDGTYVFTQLRPGTYVVQIPAAEFSGLLSGWSLTLAPAAGSGEAAVDQNDNVSHDAVSHASGSIRSNQFVLSATKSSTGAVSGNEPTGENSRGLSTGTLDGFGNLAIDLALQQPAGIDIEKEVCTLDDNSCDVTAALGEGGWSVDGVDGVGPASETTEILYGETALWRIIVTNTGDQYLTDVSVDDPVEAACSRATADIASFDDFAPGAVESWTCETNPVTQNITPNTATVVGTPNGGGTPLTDADTANVTTTGSLVVNKVVVGPGAADYSAGEFEFTIVCTDPADAEVLNVELTLEVTGAGAVTSDPYSGLPLGTSCTITEVVDGGADATPAPVTVLIVSNAEENTVIAELTNVFTQATLELTKTLTGTGADFELVTEYEFEFLIECQVESENSVGELVRATVHSGLATVVGGETVTLQDSAGDPVLLPLGARCFATETDDGGASESTVAHTSYETGVTVVASPDAQVIEFEAVNRFELAELEVRKVVTGPNPPALEFEFTVECVTSEGEPFVLAPEDAAFTLAHDESRVITVLEGVVCTVTEQNVPAIMVASYLDSDESSDGGAVDGIVTMVAGENSVEVTNDYRPELDTLAFTGAGAGLPFALGGAGLLLAVGVMLAVIARRRREGEPSLVE